jgi:hypothetical protein
MDTKHLNQVQLSRRWSISPRTLERWRWLQQGPQYLKIGGRVVYRIGYIEAYEVTPVREMRMPTSRGDPMMNGHYHPYVQAAIDGEVARLASAQVGERNNTLFGSCSSLASLGLREGEILRYLKPVAEARQGIKSPNGGAWHPSSVANLIGRSTKQTFL